MSGTKNTVQIQIKPHLTVYGWQDDSPSITEYFDILVKLYENQFDVYLNYLHARVEFSIYYFENWKQFEEGVLLYSYESGRNEYGRSFDSAEIVLKNTKPYTGRFNDKNANQIASAEFYIDGFKIHYIVSLFKATEGFIVKRIKKTIKNTDTEYFLLSKSDAKKACHYDSTCFALDKLFES